MTKHNKPEKRDPECPPERPAIALVGNMNVGKTTLFSRLCGTDTKSINFPGTTVSIPRGRIKGSCWDAIDTPGTYSIFSENEDEIISREILMSFGREGEIVGAILVADAKNLKRSVA
ncbi:MAG: 50S ribosome-binding GTPase, partial [Desulfobulbaceae bacterium]|nr:50S ribosome-binding GTPase [Desulfobulbaceae bacterium]